MSLEIAEVIMCKLSICIVLFVSSGIILAQETASPKAILIRTFYKGDFLHANNEAALDLREFAAMPGDRIAVRVCSKEPFPLALAIASGRPFLLASNLTHHGYAGESILFLRSEDCLSADPLIPLTEFWAIPKNAALPPSIEAIKSCQVRAEPLAQQGKDKESAYKLLLQTLTAKLYTKPDTVGIIVGYYLKRPSLGLKRRLREARRVLTQSGLSKKRYFVRSMPWTGTTDASDPEPVYPDVLVIEVTKDCKQK